MAGNIFSTLPENLPTLEVNKFDLDTNNQVIVRTSSKGTFSTSGLSKELKITTMDITDTATKLPTSALADRNALSIHNKSSTEILYIGNSDVEANNDLGTTAGWEVPAGQKENIDLKNDIEIYAIAPTGKTIRVKIMELA